MRVLNPPLLDGNVWLHFLYSPCWKFLMPLFLGGIAWANGQAQLPQRPLVNSTFIVSGQVSLSNGKPAGRALVKLITRGGAVFQTLTNDQGRFEFTDVTPGGFSLMASTLTDPKHQSELVQTDTSRTVTNHLNVNLTLREESDIAKSPRPGVVTVAEAEQKAPKEARKAFHQGVKYKKQEPEKAEQSFSRAIELFPDYFQALAERGDLYIFQGKLDKAAADFDRALKINAHYGPALRGAGYCKLASRYFVQAIENFQQSISVEPDNAATYLLLGIASLELDRRVPAKQALQQALVLGAIRAHIYLGNLYAREHLYQQAADELHVYLKAEPHAADAVKLRKIEAQWRARLTPN
jgi:Tfp pilus assembly protein PilF